MKRSAAILLLIMLGVQYASATHYRAGELTFRIVSYLQYEVTVTTYTTNIYQPPDNDTVFVSWGDGTTTPALRINGQGRQIGPQSNNIKVNIYRTTHQYSGPQKFFVISMQDPNRMDNIVNIDSGNSVNVEFYIEDTLKVFDPAFKGYDNSPILLNPPIDFGNLNDTFMHNPNAYDPDGDSLSFELVPSLRAVGSQVPLYVLPDQINPGIDNKITINPKTGEIIWATPKREGAYNVAILVREFRDGVMIGTVLRDMQIIIKQERNSPPHIMTIRDTCVVAGSDLQLLVTANDPDPGQVVTLTANGGPFQDTAVVPNATFVTTNGVDTAWGVFDWQTTCKDVREQFYQVVFKATDDYAPGPLVDLVTWIIKVVAPGPRNLLAKANNDLVDLTWLSPYACDSTQTSHFIGFSVWRREGANPPYIPDTCHPGLDKYYTRIKDLTTSYSYTDSNVIRGKIYCYRIQAEFALTTSFGIHYNLVSSLPSNEACVNLKLNLPIIIKVSVGNTDAQNGKDTIIWQKPFTDINNLDTLQHPGPYQFILFRSDGFTGTANRTQVASFTSQFFAPFSDTTFIDGSLNTVANPYHYEVEFYSNGVKLGTAQPASSVYLLAQRNDHRIDLSWQDSVPWLNNQYVVYRQNKVSGNFDSLTTVSTPQYSDLGLVNDSLYCYQVMSIGQYTVPGLQVPIINFSQRTCSIPHDTIKPCPPVLTATNPCTGLTSDSSCSVGPDQLKNNLVWTKPTDSCGHDVLKYNIYFSDPVGKTYMLVDSVLSPTDTSFRHSYNNSLAGCYKVTAVDSVGNESAFSNEVCVDNCPCYRLPNVFTPNGDGHNDLYTPIVPYRFIAKVEIKIFNRWGDMVYETTDPNINWNGNDTKTSKPLPEDTYYYTCKLYELREQGIVEDKDVLSGFIHLIRGNGGSNK